MEEKKKHHCNNTAGQLCLTTACGLSQLGHSMLSEIDACVCVIEGLLCTCVVM